MRAPGICVRQSGSIKLKDVARGCLVTGSPDQHCDERRTITRITPSTTGLWAPYTHRDCTCNEFVALRNRVVGAVPEPTGSGLSMLEAEARRISRQIPRVERMTADAFCKHYSGRTRSRYTAAVESLERIPLDIRKEGGIKAFVKSEKFNPSAKVNPDPRMIQARSPRFNVEVGRYLKVIEHHLYRLKSDKGLPLLGKGLSMQERGKVLRQIWDSYEEPVCVSLDGSRWDQHISKEVLEVEHGVYLRSCPDEYFAALLKEQLHNRCITSRGWKYRTRGKRMSGDMNTALGNCLLMVIMCRAYMRSIGLKGDIFDDGDDVLLLFEKESLNLVLNTAPGAFLEFGQEIKVENVSTMFEKIEWCQGHPVLGPGGDYQMVANWRKVLSQSSAGTRYWHEPTTRFDMGFSVGQCLYALYPGIPIIGKFAMRLCDQGKLNRDIYNVDWMHKIGRARLIEQLGSLEYTEPTIETRTSFKEAFGVDEVDQIHIEQDLDGWSIGHGTAEVPVECSGEWEWTYAPGTDPADREWLPARSQNDNHLSSLSRNFQCVPQGGASATHRGGASGGPQEDGGALRS